MRVVGSRVRDTEAVERFAITVTSFGGVGATFRENENGTLAARLTGFEDHQIKLSDTPGVKRIIQAQIQPMLLDT